MEGKVRCLNIYQSWKLNEQSLRHKKILMKEFFLIFSTLAKIIKKFTNQKYKGTLIFSKYFLTSLALVLALVCSIIYSFSFSLMNP